MKKCPHCKTGNLVGINGECDTCTPVPALGSRVMRVFPWEPPPFLSHMPREQIATPITEAFAYNNAVMPDAMKLLRLMEQDRARLIGMVNMLQGVSGAELNELIQAGMPKTLVEHARSQCRTFQEFNSKFPLDKVLI